MFQTSKGFMSLCVAAMSAMYLGCGSDGKDGKDGQNGLNGVNGADGVSAIVTTSGEPAGANCKNGGAKIEVGMDADGDGQLGEGEVSSVQYVCNGANGGNGFDGSKVTTSVEAAGENCKNGGIKVTVTGADGKSSDSYVCNGKDGDNGASGSTVTTSIESAGDNCMNGGIKVTVTGADGKSSDSYVCNGNDGRDAAEISYEIDPYGCANGGLAISITRTNDDGGSETFTKNICNGADGRGGDGIATSVEPAGANCADGGVKITVTDADGNATSNYVCNGAKGGDGTAGSTVTTSAEAAGANCVNGGVKITVTDADGKSSDSYVCNGKDGQGDAGSNGHNSLIAMSDYSGEACASGSGIKIETGLDVNDNNVLDADEVTSTKYVCNGVNGGSGAVGCAAEGEDYCLAQSIENHNDLDVCDTATGNCVECLEDNDCGTLGTHYCSDKVCVAYCGDGTVNINKGEKCDPNADKSTWVNGGVCSGFMGEGYIGEVGCNESCTNVDLTGCHEDPCYDVHSSEKCVTGENGGPITCKEHLGDKDSVAGVNVVCVPHETCPGIMLIDAAATESACTVEVPPSPPPAPINWCATQWGSTMTEDDRTAGMHITTADIHSVSDIGLIYGTDTSDISTWSVIPKVSDYAVTYGNNTEYQAVMPKETFQGLAAGTYYFAMAVSDGTNWYYCPYTGHMSDNVNDDGGTPTQVIDTSKMGSFTIEGSGWDNEEKWTNLTNGSYITNGSYSSTDVSGITWTWSGQAQVNHTFSDVTKGILMNKESTRYLQLNVTKGIGSMEFIWGRGKDDTKKAPKVKVSTDGVNYSDAASGVCTVSDMTATTTEAQTGTCTFNQKGTYYVRFTPNGESSAQVIIGDVKWMDYSVE